LLVGRTPANTHHGVLMVNNDDIVARGEASLEGAGPFAKATRSASAVPEVRN
jgi:hypothetical protein